jgi:hypothetical protein
MLDGSKIKQRTKVMTSQRANTENNTKTAQQHERTEIGMNLEKKNEEHPKDGNAPYQNGILDADRVEGR